MNAVLAIVAVLAAYNVVVNEVLEKTYHGAAAVGTAAMLWSLARRLGLSRIELGVTRDRVPDGIRWGAFASVALAAAVAAAALIPVTRSNLQDDTVGALDAAPLLWELLVRIPVVTAGFEEFAFRGVLFAALMTAMTARRAALVQAVLFGLWHVLPTHGPDSTDAAVAVAVAFTALAGLVFAWLHRRSGSLVAPWLLHTTANSVTMLAAWIVT